MSSLMQEEASKPCIEAEESRINLVNEEGEDEEVPEDD